MDKIICSWPYILFMKIAEPRVIRLIQFVVYFFMVIAGLEVFFRLPNILYEVLGAGLLSILGGYISLGAALGAIAVLPGIWWLERVGIIILGTGLLMYWVLLLQLGTSPIGVAVTSALIFNYVQRMMEIKGSQLAPRKE